MDSFVVEDINRFIFESLERIGFGVIFIKGVNDSNSSIL